jgi:protein-tyrosine phosphatase
LIRFTNVPAEKPTKASQEIILKTVLFLCTGNYYRSRFAEELFNHQARAFGIDWRADSRGLRREMNELHNVGPISIETLKALQERGIRPKNAARFPAPVLRSDLEQAARIIALNKREHQPMMVNSFPDLADLIEYWDVEDLDVWDARRTIDLIEQRILHLLDKLAIAPD